VTGGAGWSSLARPGGTRVCETSCVLHPQLRVPSVLAQDAAPGIPDAGTLTSHGRGMAWSWMEGAPRRVRLRS
jgi:hypothetical protein